MSIMPCYLTRTGSHLPGDAISNDDIDLYLGRVDGEAEVKRRILKMNGIVGRHYAQDRNQHPTDDVYGMGARAVGAVLERELDGKVTYLAAGTTYAPFSGPGIATLLHHRLHEAGNLSHPLETSSHGGICTSSAAALVGAIRAIQTGQHDNAICVGSEHASEVLKSSIFEPIDDRHLHSDLKRSQWFMSVFLRFMLSDGAGAFLLSGKPNSDGISLRVNWTHSMSFAHETSLCMKMESREARLSQDVSVLSRHLFQCSRELLSDAMTRHNETLDHYTMVLPHLSSFFFRRRMERVMQEFVQATQHQVPYWTNLGTAGNTGSASIYVMLDQYLRQHTVSDGDRLMLFVPESGQFNFVLVSLIAEVR